LALSAPRYATNAAHSGANTLLGRPTAVSPPTPLSPVALHPLADQFAAVLDFAVGEVVNAHAHHGTHRVEVEVDGALARVDADVVGDGLGR
jgi:hypothetical protein